MYSLNKVTLVGHLGKDPEFKNIDSDKSVAKFSIATSESWKDKMGVKKELTEWHRVVIYNQNLVKVAKSYLKKGMKIYIEGSLKTSSWKDENGNDRFVTEIVLNNYNSSLLILDRVEKSSASDDNMEWDRGAEQPAEAVNNFPF